MRTYIEIEETCGQEDETWSIFLIEQGNEDFIAKLKNVDFKLEEDGCENYLKIKEEGVAESVVDTIVKKTKTGYYDFYSKSNKIINPDSLNIESEETYIDSFYKMKLFVK